MLAAWLSKTNKQTNERTNEMEVEQSNRQHNTINGLAASNKSTGSAHISYVLLLSFIPRREPELGDLSDFTTRFSLHFS